MKLSQLVRKHCTNWRSDGKGCLGAIIDDDLKTQRCCPRPQCRLSTPGQRCGYFEDCVLPLARTLADPAYRQQFEEAVRHYRIAAKLVTGRLRPCPDCGRTMEPRLRYCPPCAAQRRKSATRKAVNKHRQARRLEAPKTRLNAF